MKADRPPARNTTAGERVGAAERIVMDSSGRPVRIRRLLAGAPFGWLLALLGGAMCVLGWYAVSGERLAARQLPYLASATAPGAALIVAGVVWAALRTPGAPATAAGPLPDEPIAADWGPFESDGEPVTPGGGLVAVPGGTLCHRPGCPLVAGKPQAVAVDGAAVRARGLAPCPVCEPDVLPEGGPL
ncbi:hypothetical protein P3T37_003632 [Kitasatospora sp. MAA4]|uniref:hypothetical protein n=1 Tax=Kitasatospora sp. MAA4 TaxID=3035093 RepID=UPI002472EFE2|nr:hypothetical protein [Kitasatospora sp. MAA4]MDH6134230.1 hypothetical protein [Kitasatospora sp. MAA4]